KGLPTATTQSPTRSFLSSPKSTVGRGFSLVILSSATSVAESVPISLAVELRRSGGLTVIFLLASTTWLLVTTKPALSMMKPEPALKARCGWAFWPLLYWLKKAPHGGGIYVGYDSL